MKICCIYANYQAVRLYELVLAKHALEMLFLLFRFETGTVTLAFLAFLALNSKFQGEWNEAKCAYIGSVGIMQVKEKWSVFPLCCKCTCMFIVCGVC